MFAETSDPLASHPRFIGGQVSGPAPVHVGGIDTAGNVGSSLGANWGLRDFQSIALVGRERSLAAEPCPPVWGERRAVPVTAAGQEG
jgi:hypothetical protein